MNKPKEPLQFFVKDIYGKQRYYLTNQEKAKALSVLTGAVTLTAKTKQALEVLGFTFEQVLEPLKA